ncbi:hypothetical protein [Pseudophaeobacter sp.]|uniref:hypothetical protein n=1 Tax=Pseudophaeobacter sp. TaxID=1971739 RepID=UPI0032974DBB
MADLRQVQERAADARRWVARMEEQLRRGESLSPQDQTFRQRRAAVEVKWRRIAALAAEVSA